MKIEHFLRSNSEQTVIYRYLELLAQRTAELEENLGVNELQALRAENRQLRAQLAQLKPPTLESLLVFLPIIYRHFWASIRPDELALLAGTLNVPPIPSPCPEPTADTILVMKQRFLNLPETERQCLVTFCRQLPHSLNPRTEMKFIFEEIR